VRKIKKYFSIFEKVPLFKDIKAEELEVMLNCIGAYIKSYHKGEVIFMAGRPIEHVGIVLEGSVQMVKDDIKGHRNIIGNFKQAELFAEAFACAGLKQSPVTVFANSEAVILFIYFKKIISHCTSACAFHTRLTENMLRLIVYRNLYLNDKLDCIGRRTTQDRVEAFLMLQRERAGQNPFDIPFNRAQMADYLCVDRSALSAVLSKMKEEGLIRFHKNRFELLAGFGD